MRRLLRAATDPEGRFSFHAAWSHWRRRHQARAQRGHLRRRASVLAHLPSHHDHAP